MLQAFSRQCDLGQEGRKVFILPISLLDLEGLLGIQLEQVPCHQQALQGQDKLYGELSLPKCWCSGHNLNEHQMVLYMQD